MLRDLCAEVTPGVEPTLHVGIGDPAGQLIDISAEQDAGAIVVGSRGRGRVTAAILGSVSVEVVHRARCPVVIVPPDLPAHTLSSGPIVCGVDGSEESLAAADLGAGLP